MVLHGEFLFIGKIANYHYLCKKNNTMNTDSIKSLFPAFKNPVLFDFLQEKATIIHLDKNELLVKYQDLNKQLFFVLEGSLIRNLITSRGEEKTIMFHTERFNEFFKSYDSVFLYKNTDYQVKANENSILLSVDFVSLYKVISSDLEYLNYYTHKTEELLMSIELFRNFQLTLTSEEYLKWLYTHYPFLFQRFSSQSIANFMGITNVWLSKLKAKL